MTKEKINMKLNKARQVQDKLIYEILMDIRLMTVFLT